MYSKIEAKSILSKLSVIDSWFGIKYNMNVYRGCQHGCIYCDTRSKCYGVGDISEIRVKINALELLNKEIKSKREKGTIGTGSMNDPYMPIEKEIMLVRKCLEIISFYNYPLHIITKSSLVERDIDIIKEISKTYAAVSLSITTPNDIISQKIEPLASCSSRRFKTIEKLSLNGIYTGVTMMPILPYITDNKDDIIEIINRTADAGGKYIIAFFGLTQREGQREYFYSQLDKQFIGLRNKYESKFGNMYNCNSENSKILWNVFNETCYKRGIKTKMKHYKPIENRQILLDF